MRRNLKAEKKKEEDYLKKAKQSTQRLASRFGAPYGARIPNKQNTVRRKLG